MIVRDDDEIILDADGFAGGTPNRRRLGIDAIEGDLEPVRGAPPPESRCPRSVISTSDGRWRHGDRTKPNVAKPARPPTRRNTSEDHHSMSSSGLVMVATPVGTEHVASITEGAKIRPTTTRFSTSLSPVNCGSRILSPCFCPSSPVLCTGPD